MESPPQLSSRLSQSPLSRVSPERSSSPFLDSQGRRRSVFKEIGLDSETEVLPKSHARSRPRQPVRFNSKVEVHEALEPVEIESIESPTVVHVHQPVSRRGITAVRLGFFAFLLVFSIPLLQSVQILRTAKAGPVPVQNRRPREIDAQLVPRQNDPTSICKRWSQQSALVNGTLYLYGGRVTTDSSQTSDTWNNDFTTLDLTNDWQIASPALTALPQPSGPPAVANGFLWNSFSQLFLYGGEYSDTPVTSPSPYALWSYDIPSSSWASSPSPTTTAGQNSDGGNQAVQESAEGAGINIPEIGRGYYFGGHLDGYTTAGWSQSIARVYLRSLIEFTFPGSSNTQINSSPTAGSSGLWRNITSGGLQDSAGFTERADGILVYVPGYGDNGIILGLAGGTNATFTQMNVIDVYDIASSTWYKQSTSGSTPQYRVNPCSVALSAPDGSSTNIYMFGGQDLVPAGQQTQYNDMWILTIPSFTWIQVDTSTQSVPPGRSGHTCNVWNSQMVVVGGYVGVDLSCDSPGIYVFDTVNLTWTNEYTALSKGQTDNPQNQQISQKKDTQGLAGSYGYQVPAIVQKVIGGSSEGGATVTAPAASASGGPLATGKPITYSVTAQATSVVTTTNSAGAKVTETSVSASPTGESTADKKATRGAQIGAIVAGVLAGLLLIVAIYFAWCAFMYRKHLALYKHHVAMAQRASLGLEQHNKNLLFPPSGASGNERSSQDTRVHASDEITNTSSGRGKRGNVGGYQPVPVNPAGYSSKEGEGSRTTADDSASISSTEELLSHGEPSFMGVLLNPRRTLRVVNSD